MHAGDRGDLAVRLQVHTVSPAWARGRRARSSGLPEAHGRSGELAGRDECVVARARRPFDAALLLCRRAIALLLCRFVRRAARRAAGEAARRAAGRAAKRLTVCEAGREAALGGGQDLGGGLGGGLRGGPRERAARRAESGGSVPSLDRTLVFAYC